ncbi:hypothetical protein L1887_47998 [Cichorium endivia]|nr:hypothetical protein L1887_47998 [Cichorium endivia]
MSDPQRRRDHPQPGERKGPAWPKGAPRNHAEGAPWPCPAPLDPVHAQSNAHKKCTFTFRPLSIAFQDESLVPPPCLVERGEARKDVAAKLVVCVHEPDLRLVGRLVRRLCEEGRLQSAAGQMKSLSLVERKRLHHKAELVRQRTVEHAAIVGRDATHGALLLLCMRIDVCVVVAEMVTFQTRRRVGQQVARQTQLDRHTGLLEQCKVGRADKAAVAKSVRVESEHGGHLVVAPAHLTGMQRDLEPVQTSPLQRRLKVRPFAFGRVTGEVHADDAAGLKAQRKVDDRLVVTHAWITRNTSNASLSVWGVGESSMAAAALMPLAAASSQSVLRRIEPLRCACSSIFGSRYTNSSRRAGLPVEAIAIATGRSCSVDRVMEVQGSSPLANPVRLKGALEAAVLISETGSDAVAPCQQDLYHKPLHQATLVAVDSTPRARSTLVPLAQVDSR